MSVELTAERKAQIRSYLNPSHLELIILPTEKCNFRCTYCYEDFKIGRMKPAIVASIKALITERATDLTNLRIMWFGGEPLMAQDIVLDISQFAQTVCRDEGIKFSSHATTNAYTMDAANLEALVEAGVTSFQITIDGDKELHDKTRVLGSGLGTYDRIIGNLEQAQATNLAFDICLRLHITRQNVASIEAAYQTLKEKFGHDSRFSFFLKAIENLGGPKSVAESVPDDDDVEDIKSRVGNLLAQNERGSSEIAEYVCYAARPNSFVIRADGSIGKCTVILNSPRNQVGRLGPDGRLMLEIDKLRAWMRGFETYDLGALHCPVDALNMWSA